MRNARWFFVVVTLLISGSVAAAECTLDLEAEEAKVRAATSCASAHAILTGCLWGSTADISRASMTREKCESEFMSRLTGRQETSYQRKLAACQRKYARQSGTMYQSMQAVCEADAARAFAGKHGSRK